ncbi:MAG: 23S rRNA (guanosine(2251)-2'-O)-methyltransferase RlmB [Humidesulfovibrio sp.]
MADSRKPSRSGTSRKPGPARKSRPGQGKREDNEWSSSGPKRSGGPKPSGSGHAPARPAGKGPGKPTGKPGAKYGGKPAGKGPGKPGEKGSAGGADRRDDRRPPRQDSRPDQRPAPQRPAKEAARKVHDDFDIDIDLDFERDPNAEPAAFPKPARPPKSSAGAKPGARYEKSDKPGRPERPGSFAKTTPQGRPAAPRFADAEPEDGKSVTAGRNPVRELLEAAPRRIDTVLVRKGQRDAKVQEIVTLADDNRIKVQFVDDAALRRLFPGSHQGVVAITAAVEYADLDLLLAAVKDAPLPVLLALDQVQDPGNLGAMARTAWALGAAGIIVPRHGGAYIGAGAMRASCGALHHLPVARVTNLSQSLDACADAGLSILCADAEGENLYTTTIHLPAVLVMGGEGKGVRHGVGKHCQQRLAIPLKRAFDSLNVAQAAAICLARLGQL